MKGSAAHTSHDLPLPFSFWSLKSNLFLIGEVSSLYCLSSQPVHPSPQLLKTLLERTRHNKTHLSHCYNLCLDLWPLYLKPFVGLQVVMWDKGGHFLVTDHTTERDQDWAVLWVPDSLSTLAGTFLCILFPLWRNYCGLKVVSNMKAAKFCLNGSWKDAACWQNQETLMQGPYWLGCTRAFHCLLYLL